MASFGVEAIRYFTHARAAGATTAGDMSYTFNRSNGFDARLRAAGHTRAFYWVNTDVWETDILDTDRGGDDHDWVDNADLFWIETHGSHAPDGAVRLLYDSRHDSWYTVSALWQLGEGWNNEWVMVYSGPTVDLDRVTGLWNIFARMHIYCGAWGIMWDGITTDECGADVADSLTDGDAVSQAWHGGVSDWYLDNHPVTVCVGDAATWNGGNIRWDRSHLNRDHLWGHGSVLPDLAPAEQACLLWSWTEG